MKRKLSGIIAVIAFYSLSCNNGTAQIIQYLGDSQGIIEVTQEDTAIEMQNNIHSTYFRKYKKSSESDSDISTEIKIIMKLKGEPLAKVFQKTISPDKRKSAISSMQAGYEIQFERLKADLKQIYKTHKRSGNPVKLEFGRVRATEDPCNQEFI